MRVVVKEIPILGPTSLDASKAALASIGQGKYYEMHTALYGAKGKFGGDVIFRIAESVGLDVERLKSDMEAPRIKEMYERNIELGKAIGIRGTPGLVIGSVVILGAVGKKKLNQLIEQARG